LRFERRAAGREALEGRAAGIRLSGEHFGRLHRLELRDWSPCGVGAVCESPIEPGTMLSLGFAGMSLRATRGTVRRCTPCGCGYLVGIEFQRAAA
jgi:hypothetical protein